jgi:large subunit ribosomal protein L35
LPYRKEKRPTLVFIAVVRAGAPERVCLNKAAMPKMKSHSGAKKRFKKTSKGKLLARHSFTSHNLGKKSAKRKRHLGRPVVVSDADHKRVTELLHK